MFSSSSRQPSVSSPSADLKSALCELSSTGITTSRRPVLPQSIGAKFEQPARTRKPRGDAPQKKHGRAPREGRAQRQHQPTANDERVGGKQRRRQQRLRDDEPMAARIGRHARRRAREPSRPASANGPRLRRATSRLCRARPCVPRRRHGLPGHGLLAEAQAAADRLHLLAHGGAGGRVHAGIGAVRIGAQLRLGAGTVPRSTSASRGRRACALPPMRLSRRMARSAWASCSRRIIFSPFSPRWAI